MTRPPASDVHAEDGEILRLVGGAMVVMQVLGEEKSKEPNAVNKWMGGGRHARRLIT